MARCPSNEMAEAVAGARSAANASRAGFDGGAGWALPDAVLSNWKPPSAKKAAITKSRPMARRGMNKALMARMGSKQRYCDCTSSPPKQRDGFAPTTSLAVPQLDLSAAWIAAYHIRD